MIEFIVQGVPAPGGSKRHVGSYSKTTKSGKVVRIPLLVDDCARNGEWREAVAWACREAYKGPPLTGAVRVFVKFFMPRPEYHYRKVKGQRVLKYEYALAPHLKAPDATKLFRSTEDALKGIAWKDDCQVVQQTISKAFHCVPRAEIRIESI